MFVRTTLNSFTFLAPRRVSLLDFLRDKSAEIDEKAVLIVVLVLGAMAGVEAVTGAITGLLNSAAAGL